MSRKKGLEAAETKTGVCKNVEMIGGRGAGARGDPPA